MGRTSKPRRVKRKVHKKRQTPSRHYYAASKKMSSTCKRGISPYVVFMQSYRNYLVKTNKPIPPVPEFGRICGRKWRNMPEAKKAPYKAYAARDAERYQEEKEAAAKVVVNPPRTSSSKSNKRPMSAFLLFYSDIRPRLVSDHPGSSVTTLSRLAGEKWRACSEANREMYKRKAEAAMIAYKKSDQGYSRKRK